VPSALTGISKADPATNGVPSGLKNGAESGIKPVKGSNTISAAYSNILGGTNNNIISQCSNIGGGNNNKGETYETNETTYKPIYPNVIGFI
jgi:hypothetical protein